MKFNLKALSPSELLRMPYKTLSPSMKFIVRQIKIFRLAFKGFAEDRVQLRASALTYYSVLSIVPLIAMIFGIAKGFGFEAFLEEDLLSRFEGQEKVLEWILTFKDRYLSQIRGGLIAGIGIVVLLWSVMKLLGNIESSFNIIWQIKKARVISRKMSDYVSLIVITPMLLFISSSVSVFLTDQIKSTAELPFMGYVSGWLVNLISLTPLVLIWLVFTLLYIIMPNTKVTFKSALIGGIMAGTMFQLLQWGYIYFQSMLTGYGAIYGSFAALPLFLIWMQTSWLIVLFGAEVAFANQNIEHFEAESESIDISNHMKRAVTLMILKEIVLNFKEGNQPETAEQLANRLDFSVRLVREVIYDLLETAIISETVTKNVKENAVQPAQDIEQLTVGNVIEMLDKRGRDNLRTENLKSLEKMTKIIDGFANEIKNSKNNKLVHELG
jgi:membrane protein